MTQAQTFVENSDLNNYGDKVLNMDALKEQSTPIEEPGCTMYVNVFPDGSKIYHLNDTIYTA